jgi:predicted DNA binding CopG/RHH family protein
MRKKTTRDSRFVPDERGDSTRHLDVSKMRPASFPDLKPSSATISLRIPIWMLHEIKRLANQRDVPYQSLIKMILAEQLKPTGRKKSA